MGDARCAYLVMACDLVDSEKRNPRVLGLFLALQNANDEAAEYFVESVLQPEDPQGVDLDSYAQCAPGGEVTYTSHDDDEEGADGGVPNGTVVSVEKLYFRDVEDGFEDEDDDDEGEEEEEYDDDGGQEGAHAKYPPPEEEEGDDDGFEDEEDVDDFGDDEEDGAFDDEPAPQLKRKKM